MAAKPDAYYQSKHNAYRYFNGESWEGARYETKEQALAAHEQRVRALEEEKRKAQEAAAKKKQAKVKPKKKHFTHHPKAYAWVIVGILLAASGFGMYWSYDNSLRVAEEQIDYPNGSIWVDPKPAKSGDGSKATTDEKSNQNTDNQSGDK